MSGEQKHWGAAQGSHLRVPLAVHQVDNEQQLQVGLHLWQERGRGCFPCPGAELQLSFCVHGLKGERNSGSLSLCGDRSAPGVTGASPGLQGLVAAHMCVLAEGLLIPTVPKPHCPTLEAPWRGKESWNPRVFGLEGP